MKFEYGNNPVVIEGNIESANYGAKEENLPFLLNMLQTTLYSDKPLAVCREYITNAWDAHVDAGKGDLPIHISIPTSFNPMLKIRDFGKGLSKNDVLHLFTSYGESGKRHTDDMVGGFGLGSKSAFCYVPSFTVVSYHGGVKMTFNAQIEEKHTTMNHLRDLDVPTDETGLEIQLAINPFDIMTFKGTLVRLLRFHKPVPEITNDTYILGEIQKPTKVLLQGSNWQILSPDSIPVNTVVLGNVPYGFDSFKFDYNFRDRLSQFGDLKFVVMMPPNSLNVTLNREALEYTQKTLTNLGEALNKAMDEYENEFKAKFQTFNSIWDAKEFLNTFRQHRVSFKPVVDGYTIKKTTLDVDELSFEDHVWLTANERWTKNGYHEITCGKQTYLFIARPDIAKSSIRLRAKMYMESNSLSKGWHDNQCFEIFQFNSDSQAEEFLDSPHVRGAKIIELNSVVLPKITKANVRTATIHSEGYDYVPSSDEFRPTTVDLTNGSGIYVPIAYNHCSNLMPLYWRTNDGLTQIFNAFKYLLEYDLKVIGIKNQEVSRLGKGWVRFDHHIQNVVNNLNSAERKMFTRHFLNRKYNPQMFRIAEFMSPENPHYHTATWLSEFKEEESIHRNESSRISVLDVSEIKLPKWEADSIIGDVEYMIDQYPILKLVKSNTITEEKEWQVVKHYLGIDQ